MDAAMETGEGAEDKEPYPLSTAASQKYSSSTHYVYLVVEATRISPIWLIVLWSSLSVLSEAASASRAS